MREETPTLLGPLERINLNHWTTHVKSQSQSYFTSGVKPELSTHVASGRQYML
jgi:hypothetical protein